MTSKTMRVAVALMGVLALNACKRNEAVPDANSRVPTTSTAAAIAPSAAPAARIPAPAVQPFDLQSVPVSTATPPPFPYVDRPKDTDAYHSEDKPFDRIYVLAGGELRAVEGRVAQRWFPPSVVNMSLLEAWRNYETAFRAMGAVRVDKVDPTDPQFIARNGGDGEAILKRLRLPNVPTRDDLGEGIPAYAQYLLRTPEKNIWLSFSVFDNGNNVSLTTVEEKAMEQRVTLVSAEGMASALDQEGHIALYLNFDTDSDAMRDDSKPAVDEIARLLRANPNLKLKVEGHTDSSGDAGHNRELSRRRAESVVHAVRAQGIDGKRLQAAGLGADKPLADNATDDGRALNRRVELVKA